MIIPNTSRINRQIKKALYVDSVNLLKRKKMPISNPH